jgi:hypothetical protein
MRAEGDRIATELRVRYNMMLNVDLGEADVAALLAYLEAPGAAPAEGPAAHDAHHHHSAGEGK